MKEWTVLKLSAAVRGGEKKDIVYLHPFVFFLHIYTLLFVCSLSRLLLLSVALSPVLLPAVLLMLMLVLIIMLMWLLITMLMSLYQPVKLVDRLHTRTRPFLFTITLTFHSWFSIPVFFLSFNSPPSFFVLHFLFLSLDCSLRPFHSLPSSSFITCFSISPWLRQHNWCWCGSHAKIGARNTKKKRFIQLKTDTFWPLRWTVLLW